MFGCGSRVEENRKLHGCYDSFQRVLYVRTKKEILNVVEDILLENRCLKVTRGSGVARFCGARGDLSYLAPLTENMNF